MEPHTTCRHGARQMYNPWHDGPAYVTQCPIQPQQNFTQTIVLDKEEGTLWWHAHNDWTRASVHGALIIYPKPGNERPYKHDGEQTIILGEACVYDSTITVKVSVRIN